MYHSLSYFWLAATLAIHLQICLIFCEQCLLYNNVFISYRQYGILNCLQWFEFIWLLLCNYCHNTWISVNSINLYAARTSVIWLLSIVLQNMFEKMSDKLRIFFLIRYFNIIWGDRLDCSNFRVITVLNATRSCPRSCSADLCPLLQILSAATKLGLLEANPPPTKFSLCGRSSRSAESVRSQRTTCSSTSRRLTPPWTGMSYGTSCSGTISLGSWSGC